MSFNVSAALGVAVKRPISASNPVKNSSISGWRKGSDGESGRMFSCATYITCRCRKAVALSRGCMVYRSGRHSVGPAAAPALPVDPSRQVERGRTAGRARTAAGRRASFAATIPTVERHGQSRQ
eukprot:6194869-Pleurochrysis_carterae.AAC.1